VASSGGRPRWAYAVIRQKEHLDTGAHGPLHSVGRRPGYSKCVCPHSCPGLGPVYIVLLQATGADTYGPGRPVLVPAHGITLPDMGGESHQITPYHPQGNGVFERNSRKLGDVLRSLLLGRGQEEWDVVLPQNMRAYRSTPHSSTQETSTFLMLGRETRVPKHLTYHVPAPESPVHEYM